MEKKAELIAKIEKKETQLLNKEQESNSLNKGKYKTSSNAKVSIIYVESLRKELTALREELVQLEN